MDTRIHEPERFFVPEAPTTSDQLRWRVVVDGELEGSWNMAIDHALAGTADPLGGVVRLYRWLRPTLSLGRNEPAEPYAELIRTEGLDVVRRPTGGRAVLHGDELTYSVIARASALGGVRAAYHRVNGALAQALRALGAPVELSEAGESVAPDAGPCFGRPAGGEIVAGGRKLVGSAQARIGRTLLQHGSILLGDDQDALTDPAGLAGAASLEALIGPVDGAELVEAVRAALREELGGEWTVGGYAGAELAEAERLRTTRYAADEWTWRR